MFLFCKIEEPRVIAENELCYAIRDGFPVTEHHTLVIPRRHTPDYFELHRPEINAIHSMMDKSFKILILQCVPVVL